MALGVNLNDFNGNEEWELPFASRFVVDSTGIIQAADVNADYTRRPEPTETTAVLKTFA